MANSTSQAMHDPNRTYTEEEIKALLERTAQLQSESKETKAKSSTGLTLTELESIAEESGLDPSLLQRAALEMSVDPAKTGFEVRTSTHVNAQRLVSGELSDEEWEEIVFELREVYDASMEMTDMGSYGQGTATKVGRNFEWRHISLSGISTRISILPHKGGTKINLTQRVGLASSMVEAWVYASILAFLTGTVTGALAGALPVAIAAVMATLAMAVPLILSADKRWRKKKLNKLNVVADRIGDIVGHEPMVLANEGSTTSGADSQHVADSQREAEPQLEVPDAEESDISRSRTSSRSRE